MSATNCHLCDTNDQTVDHVLVRRPSAKTVINSTFRWCEIPQRQFVNVVDILKFAAGWEIALKNARLLFWLFMVSYSLFRRWETKKFYHKVIIHFPTIVVDDVILIVYISCKDREKYNACRWSDWYYSHFRILSDTF